MYNVLKDIFNNSQLEVVCNTFYFSDSLILNSYTNPKDDNKEFTLMAKNEKINDYNCIPIDSFNFDIYSFGSELEEDIFEIKKSLILNKELINFQILDIYKNREEDLKILIENFQEKDFDFKTNIESSINFGLEGFIGNLILSKNLKLMNNYINTQLSYSKDGRGYNSKKEIIVKDFYDMLFNYSMVSSYRDYNFFKDQVEFYTSLGINIQKIDYNSLGDYISEEF